MQAMVEREKMWLLNKTFIVQQWVEGRSFVLLTDSLINNGGFFQREIDLLRRLGEHAYRNCHS